MSCAWSSWCESESHISGAHGCGGQRRNSLLSSLWYMVCVSFSSFLFIVLNVLPGVAPCSG